MTDHLLVETGAGELADRFLGDAVALARSGDRVVVFLTADAVGTAVRDRSPVLTELARTGAQVWVDDFVLAQRALTGAPLADGVAAVPMRAVAERLLADGVRMVWH